MKTRWIVVLVFCGLVALFLAPIAIRRRNASTSRNLYAPLAKSTIRATQPVPAYLRSLRPNYPYSVIPGGAYSPTELRNIDMKDSVVRAHYFGFNLKDARMVQLTADRYQYVSYRIKNQVYWTAKKLRIPQGEYLLTDGANFARSRCGNRLSDLPGNQISLNEPPPAVLSPPPMGPESLSRLDLSHLDLTTDPVAALAHETPAWADWSPRLVAALPPEVAAPVVITESPQIDAASLPALPGSGSTLFPLGGAPPFAYAMGPVFRPFPSAGDPPAQPPITIPVTDTPAVPYPVPEPATVYLFFVTLVLAVWGLTRVLAAEKKTDAE